MCEEVPPAIKSSNLIKTGLVYSSKSRTSEIFQVVGNGCSLETPSQEFGEYTYIITSLTYRTICPSSWFNWKNCLWDSTLKGSTPKTVCHHWFRGSSATSLIPPPTRIFSTDSANFSDPAQDCPKIARTLLVSFLFCLGDRQRPVVLVAVHFNKTFISTF